MDMCATTRQCSAKRKKASIAVLITALLQSHNNNSFSQTNFQHQACLEINCGLN